MNKIVYAGGRKKITRETEMAISFSRKEDIRNIRIDTSQTENRKSTEKNNKNKGWVFENRNIINKPLSKLRKKERRQNWKSKRKYYNGCFINRKNFKGLL